MPPCTAPRMLQCLRSARSPSTRPAPSPREYTGPIISMTGLERASGLNPGGTNGDEVVLADSLQHEKGYGLLAAIGHKMRAARGGGERLAGSEAHLLLGFLQEDAQLAREHVERVGDVVVVMPGHLLHRRELQLGDAESRPRRVLGAPLYFVERACVLDRFHACLLLEEGKSNPGRRGR